MKKHHRRSLRLKDYDYTSDGAYYITVCTRGKKCLFGTIVENKMCLNEYGEITRNEWVKTSMMRPNVKLDEFIVMPNHIHGIIIISNNQRRGVLQYAPTHRCVPTSTQHARANKFHSPSQTIGSIVRGFKSTVTKQINTLQKTLNNPIWQRNYYEHIIRNDESLNEIREYIMNNPVHWEKDEENINACRGVLQYAPTQYGAPTL